METAPLEMGWRVSIAGEHTHAFKANGVTPLTGKVYPFLQTWNRSRVSPVAFGDAGRYAVRAGWFQIPTKPMDEQTRFIVASNLTMAYYANAPRKESSLLATNPVASAVNRPYKDVLSTFHGLMAELKRNYPAK